MINFLKKYSPVLFIVSVWFVFSFPVLFKNLTPFPSRYQVAFFGPWSAYSQFFAPVKNDAMPDIIGQIYPWKQLTISIYKLGEVPLWNPYSFSGTPHIANYQSAAFSLINLGFFVFPFIDWWSFIVLLQPLLAGLFTYLLMGSYIKRKEAKILSAVSFMFCGFITCWMGYATLGYAVLFLPLGLYFVEKYFKTSTSYYLPLLSCLLPLSFFSGHFQISIYFLLAVVAYTFFKAIQTKKIRETFYLSLSLFFGLLICMPQLLPTFELYSQSVRSNIIQKTEAIPWVYIPTLLAPDYFGNPVTRNAWLGHYAEWNGYIGVIGIFFAGLSLTRKKTIPLFFVITGLFSLLLAFDTPALDLLIALRIPVLSTSAASRIIVLFSFSLSVLAGFGFEYFIDDISRKKNRKVFVALILLFVCILILWFMPFFKIGFVQDHAQIAKSNLKLPTVLFISLSFLILPTIFVKNKKFLQTIFILIIVLVSLEMLRFSTKWIPYDPKNLVYPTTAVTKYFKNLQGYNRVFGNFGAEDFAYYHLQGVEGYDALYIRRYGQFIKYLSDGKLSDSERSGVTFPKQGKYSLEGANLLGIRYIVHKISDGQKVWEFPFWKYDPKSIKLLLDDGHYQILENTNAYPRAFLVKNILVESNNKKILDKMFATNLKETAFVDNDISFSNGTGGSARILEYSPNKVEIETIATSSGFLILTDSYYPGWHAKIDGEEVKIYRTDYTFRGLKVPKGKHTVIFTYNPESFRYGVYTAIIGISGICLLLMLRPFKNKK